VLTVVDVAMPDAATLLKKLLNQQILRDSIVRLVVVKQ